MKRNLLFGILPVLMLSSCVEMSTVLELDSLTEPSDAVFTAITEIKPTTRTALSDNTNTNGCYSLFWSSGDEISISDGERLAIYVTDEDGSSTAEFRHKNGTVSNNASEYIAFYPSTITVSNMVLPSTQNYVKDNVEHFPMYAKSINKELAFKNLCGIIRLCIKTDENEKVSIASLSLSGNKGMSGSFTIGDDNEAVVDGTDGVVLNCMKPCNLSTSVTTDFNIIVPQGDYNPLKIKIRNVQGEEIRYESEEAIKVIRSEITRINLTVSKSSFNSSLETIPITDSDVEFTER